MTRSRLLRAVGLATLVAVVFGTAAMLLALRSFPTYQATLQLRIAPDPVIGLASTIEEVDTDTFLASEVVVLNGPELRNSLGDLLPAGAQVSARTQQLGTSALVVISAVDDTPEEARQAVDAIAARYAGRRRDALLERVDAVRILVQRQLDTATARIDDLADEEGVTSSVQRESLTSELTRLVGQQNALQLAADTSNRLVTIVKPSAVGGVPQIISPARDAVFWAVLGGTLGLGLAAALDRWRRRVWGLEDLLELAPDLALPTLPTVRGDGLAAKAGDSATWHVSALTPVGKGFAEPALVVVAPRPGAGATHTAVALAVASARRGPTLLVAAGDVLDGAAARLLGVDPKALRRAAPGDRVPTAVAGLLYVPVSRGAERKDAAGLADKGVDSMVERLAVAGTAVVVDAPALSVSPVALDLARQAASVLLVGGVDRTRAGELDIAARTLRRAGGVVVGIVLSTPVGGRLPRSPAA